MNYRKKLFAILLAAIMAVAIFPSTIFAAGVDIPDTAFKTYLNGILKQDANADITAEQMATIKKIDLQANSGVKDVKGIENCANLTFFRIWRLGKVTNYENVSDLTELTYLCINGGSVEDLGFVRNLTKLTSINFWNNNIQDISPLADLKNLDVIDLSHNNIYDASPLSGVVDNMGNWLHAHDQQVTFNETCNCDDNPCTKKYINPVKGIHGEILTPINVTGATYDAESNSFTLDAGAESFSYEFKQETKPGSADFENYFSGKVTFNITHEQGASPLTKTYRVTYGWQAASAGKPIPEAVLNLLPAEKLVEDGSKVIADNPPKERVKVKGGMWIFKGWKPAGEQIIDGNDIHFNGLWEFVDEAALTHNKDTHVDTGDNSYIMLWAFMGIISAIIAVSVVVIRRWLSNHKS